MRQTPITIVLFSTLLGSAVFCGGGGNIKTTGLSGPEAGKLAIGFLENRHGGYRVFPVKNFQDSLEFEFMEQGYEILEYSPDLLSETHSDEKVPKSLPSEKAEAPRPRNDKKIEKIDPLLADPEGFLSRSDVTDNLFPEKLRAIAGERGALRRRVRARERYLAPEEIKKLSASLKFDYFVQGAVGTTERNFFGAAFDEEEDSLIFLKIYDREGRRVGAIRFTVDEEDYSRASFLTDISRRIVENFSSATAGAATKTRGPGNQSESNDNPPAPEAQPKTKAPDPEAAPPAPAPSSEDANDSAGKGNLTFVELTGC